MATCMACFCMGYPTVKGKCARCRKGEEAQKEHRAAVRERESNFRTRVKPEYKQVTPLGGGNYEAVEKMRNHFPFRRPAAPAKLPK